MSIFSLIGETVNGSATDEEGSAEETDDVEVTQTGPNFMPEKQKQLYLQAHNNAIDLNDSGVCSRCGTTLSPVKAERLFASCKNEDCENHLGDREIAAANRWYGNNGHPDGADPDEELEASRIVTEKEESALDGLTEAMGKDEE